MTIYLLVSMEPMAREMGGIRILPWTDFLDGQWGWGVDHCRIRTAMML